MHEVRLDCKKAAFIRFCFICAYSPIYLITMKQLEDIKQRLYDACKAQVDSRVEAIQRAMSEAQQAANQESKSSVGDKYETGRAMMQLEKEKSASQLNDAMKLRKALDDLNVGKIHDVIDRGSVIETNQGNFFIAVGIGEITSDDKAYFAISPASPIASELIGLKLGEEITLNGRQFVIEKVF